MNFRILNYFLTVAHEKNITKAAEVLHITQPTLSRQLMQLEEDLGTKLFDRSQHKFALTPSGQFLVQRAQEILDMVEKTTLDIQEQSKTSAEALPSAQVSTMLHKHWHSLSELFKGNIRL